MDEKQKEQYALDGINRLMPLLDNLVNKARPAFIQDFKQAPKKLDAIEHIVITVLESFVKKYSVKPEFLLPIGMQILNRVTGDLVAQGVLDKSELTENVISTLSQSIVNEYVSKHLDDFKDPEVKKQLLDMAKQGKDGSLVKKATAYVPEQPKKPAKSGIIPGEA